MDENKCKLDPTNRMKFGLVVANILKYNCKRLQVACSHKWSGYILADFY